MDCVFCDLLADRDRTSWLTREEHVAAFLTLPRSALSPGHTLVIPTDHVAGIHDASEQSLARSMALVRRVALAMRQAFGATGVNVLNASGPGSEQSVLHLHFHVVPRWTDNLFSTWPTARSAHQAPAEPGVALAAALSRQGSSPFDNPPAPLPSG